MNDPVQLFKCLSEPTRLRCMLLLVREGELCVCELMAALKESQPKVSRHLAQLKSCNLLLDRRQGQWVFYRLNPALADWAHVILQTTSEASSDFIAANLERLAAMAERPVRPSECS